MTPPTPHPSALQSLLKTHTPATPGPPDIHPYKNLTLQIAHNLRHQHAWTRIRIHWPSPSPSPSPNTTSPPRPLISGLPPRRLYTHPDEQIELLQSHRKAGLSGIPEMKAEREWVLPCSVREKWTLGRFGEVFDSVGKVPGFGEGSVVEGLGDGGESEEAEGEEVEGEGNSWRTEQPKRILMAILDDDSTVVYYIVHDGLVKPRQN
ncbi:uncharacterized protein LTR77_002549 [Saxophila tyrrhenica]|uniref:tRNA-splicing endonuclease subunit Sen15 domain-containing protein n=1 Tax=Saxophila tyrrhenica TaxID=1690608 RepID=A0AAV9PK33_9PEZI|nr:hypothetical protein LTR77_002549 [Saxophila tyrrhenica]